MMKVVLLYLSIVFFAIPSSIHAQGAAKKEREKSITADKFPPQSLSMIESLLEQSKRMHYYLETDGESVSYEVKLKYKKQKYSIEFDADGQLLDIEKLIEWDDLDETVQSNMNMALDEKWERSKVMRLQRQFRYREGSVRQLTELPPSDANNWEVLYELEVEVQKAAKEQLTAFELLFDSRGALISFRPIEKVAIDNLIY